MKIAERGQITIPKKFREQLGFVPGTDVEFVSEKGRLFLRKKASRQRLKDWDKWVGHCSKSGGNSTDDFIESVRGR